eukprot:Clim_evm49s199 gene=Clim_evmTU49s199
MEEEDLQRLYLWLDEIPLSRPKRNITRDFSDGVMAAEVVKHYIPKIVDLHNYPAASNSNMKANNWKTLNQKVFKKLNFFVPESVVKDVASCKQGVVEVVLNNLRVKIEAYVLKHQGNLYPQPAAPAPFGMAPMGAVAYDPYGRPIAVQQPHQLMSMQPQSISVQNETKAGRGIAPMAGPNRGAAGGRAPTGAWIPTRSGAGKASSVAKAKPQQVAHPLTEEMAAMGLRDEGRPMDGADAALVGELKEMIEILQSKVSRLEYLLEIKEKRVDELSMHLKRHGIDV